MKVVGTCNGEVMLEGQMPQVFDYLLDHKKIIGFNPFCKGVTPTELDKVYRWDFEVSDPTGHPIHLIFFVEQIHHQATHGVQKQSVIKWVEYPVVFEAELPNDWTFLGKANGQLTLNPKGEATTCVEVGMHIEVPFHVPQLLQIFPEMIVKKMAELAMSVSMQAVSTKMLENITKDFKYRVLEDRLAANLKGKAN